MSRSLEQWSWSLVIYDTVDNGQLLWDIKRQHINFAKNTSELYKHYVKIIIHFKLYE